MEAVLRLESRASPRKPYVLNFHQIKGQEPQRAGPAPHERRARARGLRAEVRVVGALAAVSEEHELSSARLIHCILIIPIGV